MAGAARAAAMVAVKLDAEGLGLCGGRLGSLRRSGEVWLLAEPSRPVMGLRVGRALCSCLTDAGGGGGGGDRLLRYFRASCGGRDLMKARLAPVKAASREAAEVEGCRCAPFGLVRRGCLGLPIGHANECL